MTTIYCITGWNSNNEQTDSKMFMTLEGAAKWLTSLHPIDNQFSVRDRDFNGNYDITADNLRTILNVQEKQGFGTYFYIQQECVVFLFETRFILSTIEVED